MINLYVGREGTGEEAMGRSKSYQQVLYNPDNLSTLVDVFIRLQK